MPIEEEEIVSLQKIVASGVHAGPWPFMKVGQRIRIVHGALEGVEGLLSALKGTHRLVVSITLLQRSVAVEVDEDWIIALGQSGP
jgi:transcription antitermination factor NusG